MEIPRSAQGEEGREQDFYETSEERGGSEEEIRTPEGLEFFVESEMNSLICRVNDILSLGQKSLRDGLASIDAQIGEESEDYREVTYWMEKIKGIPAGALQEIKKILKERGLCERVIPFGEYNLVIASRREKIETDDRLEIFFEDKGGTPILDFRELLPRGVRIIAGEEHSYDPRRDEITLNVDEKKMDNFPKEIIALLHELGHAWQYHEAPQWSALREYQIAKEKNWEEMRREIRKLLPDNARYFIIEDVEAGKYGREAQKIAWRFMDKNRIIEEEAESKRKRGELSGKVGKEDPDVILKEKDAWFRAMQIVSAVRQARGIDIISQYSNWDEVEEHYFYYFATHLKSFLKRTNLDENFFRELFKKEKESRGDDLKIFEEEVGREVEEIIDHAKDKIRKLYENFLRQREINPSLTLCNKDFDGIIIKSKPKARSVFDLWGTALIDQNFFSEERPSAVMSRIDSLGINERIKDIAKEIVIHRKISKVLERISGRLAEQWEKMT